MVAPNELALASAEAWVHSRALLLIHNGTPATSARGQALKEFEQRFPTFDIKWS